MRTNFSGPTVRRQLATFRLYSNSRLSTSFQEIVDEKFLNGMTFGNLADRSASSNSNGGHSPVLLINAASYDDGRRFIFSNLCIPEGPAPVENEIAGNPLNDKAVRALTFSRADCARPAPRDIPLSLAVATSAAFPGGFGPVTLKVPTSCDGGRPEYWHLGDGGLFDNTGVDTLEEIILREHRVVPRSLERALIISIDSGMKGDAQELRDESNLWVLTFHPGLITEAFNKRAQSYHNLLWDKLRSDLSDEGLELENILFRYTSATLDSWPASCKQDAASEQQSPEEIRDAITARLAMIGTALKIPDCDADLLDLAAHDIVHSRLNAETLAHLKSMGFPVNEAHVSH